MNDPFFMNLVGGAWGAAWGVNPATRKITPESSTINILGAYMGRDLQFGGWGSLKGFPEPSWVAGNFGRFNLFSPSWGAPTGGLGGMPFLVDPWI